MLISYNWLNKYFDERLPSPEVVAEALTFHSWEIDEVKKFNDDTVLDVKVLPDNAMWALSHRGVAKDLSVILNLPLAHDPLSAPVSLTTTSSIGIKLESDMCRRFAAAHIRDVQVKPSPKWLSDALEAVGQRSINNIVDASNFVMFDLGQPSHTFDARLVGSDGFSVRPAKAGETLLGLDEVEYTFTLEDTLITRSDTDEILSIAGLKGGQHSGINTDTTDVIVEVANWDPVAIRKTGQRLKLRTDASTRYENGIVPEMVPYGLQAVVDLILKVAGGEVVGYSEEVKDITKSAAINVPLTKINNLLGVTLTVDEVTAIFDRFGWQYEQSNEDFTVTSPFERTDLVIPEDIIEEIGRVYGYEHIDAVTPAIVASSTINKRFYYSELVRDILIELGWSEVYTSSFRPVDQVKVSNAFASDKGYLRSTLVDNIKDALTKNAPNSDLLGLTQVKIFEIGTTFQSEGESYCLTMGVRSPTGYKPKLDDPSLAEAVSALEKELNVKIRETGKEGVLELDLEDYLENLPQPTKYNTSHTSEVTYQPFSSYPAIARDIAMWTEGATAESVEAVLNENAGELRVRTTLFDEFSKDGHVSYAFRLVFQAPDRTLTDKEVNVITDKIYEAVKEKGWETR